MRARSRRRVRGRLRDVQPAQHQPVDCRLDAELRGADRGGPRARPRGPCLSFDVVRLPLRRARARGTRRRAGGGAHRHGRRRSRGQRHHRRRPSRPGRGRRRGGDGARACWTDRAALPRHARHGARKRLRGSRVRRRDVRQLGWRARGLPLRAGRCRQPRDRGPDLPAEWIGNRDRCDAGRRGRRITPHCAAPRSRTTVALSAGREVGRPEL